MGHHALKSGYRHLVDRLNRFPQGAPPSTVLYRILNLLMREKEAFLLSRLPLKPVTAATAARIWKVSESFARAKLDELAERALLLDLPLQDRTFYLLPPPMAGFFEFSLMRLRSDLDQKSLSRHLYQYLNVEEEFARELFSGGATQIGRVLVHEPALPDEPMPEVLDYERASEIIRTARHIGVGLCYCRHKMAHVGKGCEAPLNICMALNTAAEPLIRHGHARRVDAAEGLDMLQEAWSRGLVQSADNVREGVNFICHCCGCCCEALVAAKRLALPHPVMTTNYIPDITPSRCTGCGDCASVCPVEAMTLAALFDSGARTRGCATVREEACLGCGICVRTCRQGAIRLASRPQRVVTPLNTVHRVVLMALERGKLAELIFDNRAFRSHRVMGAILEGILKLPPMKRLLASRQLRSRYLERVLADVQPTTFTH